LQLVFLLAFCVGAIRWGRRNTVFIFVVSTLLMIVIEILTNMLKLKDLQFLLWLVVTAMGVLQKE